MKYVLIVDDERNIQKAYKADIEKASDRYELVDAIMSANDAEMVCASRKVNLILMDLNTAFGESGISATARIKRKYPDIKIIITTSYLDPQAIQKAKDAGADSFWFKDISPIELIEVMDRTMNGDGYWPSSNPDVQIGAVRFSELTESEREVLLQIARSISIRKTAEALSVEETTVKYHLRNICEKVQCKNKTELLVLVIQNKMILP